MVKLRDLEYLDAIDRYRHFGKAAEACFVSQPTLSGQIMKLEEQLSLQLVERHRRNVMLTPAGEQLVLKAREVLGAARVFEDTARELLDPLSGDLHVGMIPTLAPYLLPHIMGALHQKLPDIRFYLHEKQTRILMQELNEGSLDVLILPWLDDMKGVERYDLFAEPLDVTVADNHPLAQKEAVTFDDLNNQPILTLEDGHCLRDQALGYCFTAGAREDHRFQATSLETLRYMVASGSGMTLLPRLACLHRHHDGARYLPFEQPQPTRQISLLVRPGYSRMACVRAVVACVKQQMQDII
ncbi:DNA-binding transcriptional regulator OxyR [Oceanospirillum sediminis]|uniref:DNA-binding transcriptional regulator OxyR n=1 Tax=Oceanospirillum sediminis TaxID=2760088 RepID=A0A839IQD7_9GAMM|nr:DNA-binding transcriptional regulator OxyR [Oceanospirillum sediminis]MBB1486920.1 DNA-binding transcriptional regulator OxyR [Oceanospirillum sediminis]